MSTFLSRASKVSCAAIMLSMAVAPAARAQTTTISSNFNGTNLTNPEYVWFTSHLTSLTGVPLAGGTLFFTGQTITIVDASLPGGQIVLSVPDGSIVIDPTTGGSSILFDAGGSQTIVLNTSDNPILSVLSWQVPGAANLGGANPVTWSGNVSVSWVPTTTVTMNWQWAAAAYMPFTTNYPALGVLPTDESGLQSGTPLNYITGAEACIGAGSNDNCVVGGARGGGGSNYTGSNSGTASVVVNETTTVPEPASLLLLSTGLLGLVPFARRRRR